MSEETRGYLQAQQAEIHYTYARFHRRVFANLLDFILCAFIFIACFVGIRAIVVSTPAYQEKENTLLSLRIDSGLYYQEDSGLTTDIVSHLNDKTANFSAFNKMMRSSEAIDKFIVFVGSRAGDIAQQKAQQDYDDYRLQEKYVYQGVHYFIVEEGKVSINPSCGASAESYYNGVFAPYIDEHCQTYLVTLVPEYLELVRFESNMLFYAELIPAYAIAPFITYLLPMLIFRRGRKTFGKALYRIGVLDSRLLVPTIPRTLARFFIFYVAEWLLTPITFAIPFLVSATLMGFSKAHQGFPDYMLRLFEVDTSNEKIYFTREEILLDGVGREKAPVDFQPRYED